MAKDGRDSGVVQATTGLLLMAARVVLLLDQQGIIEVGSIGRWWPLALVVAGVFKTPPRGASATPGAGRC